MIKPEKFDPIKMVFEVAKEIVDIIFKSAMCGFWIHFGWEIFTRIK